MNFQLIRLYIRCSFSHVLVKPSVEMVPALGDLSSGAFLIWGQECTRCVGMFIHRENDPVGGVGPDGESVSLVNYFLSFFS